MRWLVLLAALSSACLAQGQEQAELERAAARAAIEARDDQRIIVYGERVLARQPDDLQIPEQVTRALGMRESDPNAQLIDPMEFTLTGLDGQKLSMASLKGKVVVFDFWATWCEPCRGQHPLYEQVKQRFKDSSEVVFRSIDTDEDREPVKRFLEEEKWLDQVYFEDGLSRALRITTIAGNTRIMATDEHG
jgi:thiol-disulfide isomerase/thioredoxin